jgi:hypothetical protein
MVREFEIKGKKYYECQKCYMDYSEQELAEKCEHWCAAQGGCNPEYIKQAVGAVGQLLKKD